MKRVFASIFISAFTLCAQGTSVSATTEVDINGHRVQAGPQVTTNRTSNGVDVTETMQSINGRTVPLERVEEQVLQDNASGRIVERVIRRFDPQGNPTPPLKERIEEYKNPNGSSTTVATTYRGDINGSMQLAQKSVTELTKSGSEERSETVVQEPTVNGSLNTVEKQDKVKSAQSNGYREEANTYRRDGNGGFYDAVRTVTDHTQQGSESTDNTVQYESNPTGGLQVRSQKVAKTVTAADGSKDTVLNIYGLNVPGTVNSPGSALKLQEQQLIQSQKGPNDTVTQTVNVRRPSVSDPNTLGPSRQISQTVCQGACKP